MALSIEIRDLQVDFPARGGGVQALRGLNLAVEQGAVVGFLGPNGAGKTTALHVLLGFVEPTAGSAFLFGEDVRRSIAHQRLGYLPEHPQLYPFLTGRELLEMAGGLFGLRGRALQDRVGGLLEQVGIGGPEARRRIGTYSRGMMQRIGLAQALVNEPDLVILDEPTGGLDPIGRLEMRGLIARLREQGKTVFFSSHELSEVELVCDRIAILARGRLVAEGRAADLVAPGERLEAYFLRMVQGGAAA
ncbi:MAG: ABC transporter ATP-binding protein [Verrucomicrobia bacterium]|nr:ABC transporter ATP-binding protein [Verrucomicrobiota bacterium]